MAKSTARPMVRIYTSADEFIDREMTNAEFAEHQSLQTFVAAEKATAQAKATQKAALLERLGISEDEARLLLA
jgi:predicted Ser/Thr protein kinase